VDPHDLLFKSLFSRLDLAKDQLQAVLPPVLVAAVDWDSLTLMPSEFIDVLLDKSLVDLLYRVKLQNGADAYLWLLFEHQSTTPRWAPLQAGDQSTRPAGGDILAPGLTTRS